MDNVPSLTNDTNIDIKYYIGGSEAIPMDQREKNAIKSRHLGAEMLGNILLYNIIFLFIEIIFTYYIFFFF